VKETMDYLEENVKPILAKLLLSLVRVKPDEAVIFFLKFRSNI